MRRIGNFGGGAKIWKLLFVNQRFDPFFNPSLAEVRRQFGGPGLSDEELVLRVFGREEAVEAT
ncbi:MAG: hypothetical protein V3U33_08330 [candidate division NC10 bacterium]